MIILSAVYIGNLTASLAVRRTNLPFNTLRGLADDNSYLIRMAKGTHIHQLFEVPHNLRFSLAFYIDTNDPYLQTSESGIYKDIWDKVQRSPKESLFTGEMLQDYQAYMSYTGPKLFAYVLDWFTWWETRVTTGVCGVSLLREDVMTGELGIVIKQSVPYKKHLSRV